MAAEKDVLELEGMVSTLTVLRILSTDLAAVRLALRSKVGQMPGFFQDAPIAVDISELEPGDSPAEVSLQQVVDVLRAEKLVPVAVRNLREDRRHEASALGLACLRGAPRASRVRKPKAAVEQVDAARYNRDLAKAVPESAPALLLQQPVRGGQVIYAEQCDAIVIGPINSGGELIADGNIHVYGALRGRALAGAHGNEAARIFCTSLQADLVSIAGSYLSADEIPESHRGKPAQIYLSGDALVVTDL